VTINHAAIFLAGLVTGQLAMLWVISMARASSDDLPARSANPKDRATPATGNTGASTRATADGLPLSEYMQPLKSFRCLDCGKIQRARLNPTTCACGCGAFSLVGGPLRGAIVDHDRAASAIISPASAAPTGLDSSGVAGKRSPRVR
jgi:hypothetical protein